MSLQFRSVAMLMLLSLTFACASIPRQSVATSAAALGDIVADTRSLVQPSNAARLDALQRLLEKRVLAFSLQPFPNGTRQRDPRDEGQNVLLDPMGGDGPPIIVGAHLDAVPLSGGGHSHGMIDNG